MNYKQKSGMKITGLIPAIVAVCLFIIAAIFWGPIVGFYFLGFIILLYCLLIFYGYLRTKHSWTLLSAIYMLCYSGCLLTLAPHMIEGQKVNFPVEFKVLLTITLLLGAVLIYLNSNRKLKWRGREILELAAQQVNKADGSFTERPRATAVVNYSERELLNFASYFERNLLGLCYREADRIVFMPLKYKNEYFALYNPAYKYENKTWVAINFNGNVSVNICKADYFDYREDLAFDDLCTSLSEVVIEFIELYLNGADVRIIDKMDDLRMSVFT